MRGRVGARAAETTPPSEPGLSDGGRRCRRPLGWRGHRHRFSSDMNGFGSDLNPFTLDMNKFSADLNQFTSDMNKFSADLN